MSRRGRLGALAALLVALLMALLSGPPRAETVVPGLSQNRVAITANFDGSEILVFGAVRREAPEPEGPPLEVIVTLRGPSAPVEVWRKARRFGIWVNAAAVRVSRAPVFYAVATTGPLDQVLSATEDIRHEVSIPRAIRAVGIAGTEDSPAFLDALIRIREAQGLYQLREGSVELIEGTLLRTAIRLPANLTEGRFVARILLTRGGVVIDDATAEITVQKVGLERVLHRLAMEQPLVYGLLSLFLAIAAGWAAAEAFRRLRA